MSELGRPQTAGQKSRKGRRAWRKNVDIQDIETKLQEQREEIIHHGIAIDDDAQNEDLFIIDEDADEEGHRVLKRDNIKKLKSTEILENKSKVPALMARVGKSKKKVQGVNKKEMVQLLKLAGKVKGFDKGEERLAKEGIINSKAYDVWDTPLEHEVAREQTPDALKQNSSISFMRPTVVPKTLKEAPILVKKQEIIPHAGKSYNPSLDNWKNLIDQEYFKEKSKDDQRLELEEYQARVQFLIQNYEDNEIEEIDDTKTDDEEEKAEAEAEAEVNVEDVEEGLKLSINPVTKLQIKTKAQRNKEKRNKERQILENELREIKLRIKELEKLPDILQQVSTAERVSEEQSQRKESKQDKLRKKNRLKLGSRFEVIEGPLEVKLSNELSDSLRKLKPEGNLLYDQMKNMQSKGLIETRRYAQGKKGKKKVTEKWTYKDFK